MTAARQRIGLFQATMLVAGNMIGSGVFLMPASMAPRGGMSLLGWLVAVPAALLLALVFARLATRRPMDGGPYAWARQAFGDYTGFSCNALYWLGNVVGNVAIAVSVVGYASVFLSALVGPRAAIVATLATIWLAIAANIAGPRLIGAVESATTLLGLVPIIGIAILGWWWFQPGQFAANWNPAGASPLAAVSGSLTIMFWAFTGVESAAVATGVVIDPARNVARATLLGVALAACVYVGSTAVVFGLVPAQRLADSPAPFETAIAAVLGAGPALVMAFCAMVKAAGALGGWVLLTAESGRAAANDGLFARIFARVDRRGVPVAGLIVTGVLMSGMQLASLAPSLGGIFGRLVSMSTLLIIPAYLFSAVALSLDAAERRTMRALGLLAAIAVIGVAAAANLSDALIALVLVLATAPLFAFRRIPTAATRSETIANRSTAAPTDVRV
ncbi:MAG TPA: amino acid permease [Acetobacteraceae bacterium]|nr:amino acid permease [Acetobacteraceae bacterium]